MKFPYEEFDLSGVKTYPLASRRSKANSADFATPFKAGSGVAGLIDSLPDILAAAKEAMAAGIPVVLTTRAPAGRVSGAYGFPGGGATWLAAGAIPAGTLAAPSARVALALGLGAGLDDAGLRALLAG